MDFLPIFLDIKNSKIIIDGGTMVAARRTERALQAGGRVFVFNPELSDEFLPLLDNENLTHIPRLPKEEDFLGCKIAFGASEDENRDRFLAKAARKAGALVNIADRPEFCDFISPSIVDRNPLIIAISSSGKTPVIARILRARIEALIPPIYGDLASFLGKFREIIASKINNSTNRRHFWERIIDGSVADKFLTGDENGAKSLLMEKLQKAQRGEKDKKIGEVFLVGAGPGDPDLLTFRALRLMQRADIVLYDRLVSEDILNLVRRDAERINVGKLPKNHTMAQEEITALMIKLAKSGKKVLRLKGGDPFMFGRGGEEIEQLCEHNIDFQIIPGISAAVGASAYGGIPLTHRDYAQSCIFVTAHGKNGKLDLDWKAILRPFQTVVIYMGMANLQILTEEFINHGADPKMSAAIIENATRRTQRIIIADINSLYEKAKQANIKGPAIIIIGDVVKLHSQLKWNCEKVNKSHKMSLKAQKNL